MSGLGLNSERHVTANDRNQRGSCSSSPGERFAKAQLPQLAGDAAKATPVKSKPPR